MKPVVLMLLALVFANRCDCWLDHAMAAKKAKPRLTKVWTMQGCAPCSSLEKLLERKGVSLTRACYVSKVMPVDAFPTCDYSDGVTDDGSRVRGNQCSYGSGVLVLLWMEPKEKEK